MRWLVLLVTGCGLADTPTQGVVDQARCAYRTQCHEYEYADPATRNAIAASCGGEFAEDGCSTGDALGACRDTGPAPLVATYIYRGYPDVAGFVAGCRALGGTWNPE